MRCDNCRGLMVACNDPAKRCTVNGLPYWRCTRCGCLMQSDVAKATLKSVLKSQAKCTGNMYDVISTVVLTEDYV